MPRIWTRIVRLSTPLSSLAKINDVVVVDDRGGGGGGGGLSPLTTLIS